MYQRNYTRKYKIFNKVKFYIVLVAISLSLLFFTFIYYFDSIIAPTVLTVADGEMRAKVMDIINKNISEIYGENFNYDEMIKVEKDSDGKIIMLKADTSKLNTLAMEVAMESQEEIKDVGEVGVKIPIGYIAKNNIMAYWGPKIKIRMVPIGRVETSYSSTFESAGINQSRHKIYINLKTKLKVIMPFQSTETEVVHQIPISETIIVGEVPRVNFGKDLFQESMNNEENEN